MPKEKERSIANDLKDFLKEHIVPLKKGEVVKGSQLNTVFTVNIKNGHVFVINEGEHNAKRRMLS